MSCFLFHRQLADESPKVQEKRRESDLTAADGMGWGGMAGVDHSSAGSAA